MEPKPPDSGAAVSLPSTRALSDPERWVDDHGEYLFKFAVSRLRDATRAEDLVQETFLAALRGGETFSGRSAERSWLTGILRNKIFDHFRKAGRETAFTDLQFYSEEEADNFVGDADFKRGWAHDCGPLDWPSDHGASLDSPVFWSTFQECSQKLPRKIAAVFTMREVDGVESREICRILEISESNLWVMLHRARMALRRCLETNWFGKGER